MTLCRDLRDLGEDTVGQSGGKASALARLLQRGFAVPNGFCILTEAYRAFVDGSPLAERIRLELGRKEFRHMRWEELWDAALRIRHLFAGTEFPVELESELRRHIESGIGSHPAAVRSSAIGEDSGQMSFAGLHESVLNVEGTENILQQVKNVWASLWSDAALLYRQELGLDVERSAMAVLVQHFVPGDCSGVIFSQSPLDPQIAVIEAVAGLAKGLVDGAVEPERWEIDRDSGTVLSRTDPSEQRRTVAVAGGTRVVEEERAEGSSVLSEDRVTELYETVRRAEQLFGSPQDMEWTYSTQGLQILQSRPVTARKEDPDSKRVWNLSLRRSYDNLRELQQKIEGFILPGMAEEADALELAPLEESSDAELAAEIERRLEALERWTDVYWEDLIPFAHGMRLFGQVYNEAVRPKDPFAFVTLLRPDRLESVERNRLIRGMAEIIRENPRLRDRLGKRPLSECRDERLDDMLQTYNRRYGNLLGIQADRGRLEEYLRVLLLEMSDPDGHLNSEQRPEDTEELERRYLASFRETDREHAGKLLELGRASYRIRDDDNIYLDRFKGLLREAEAGARRRLLQRGMANTAVLAAEELIECLRDPSYQPEIDDGAAPAPEPSEVDPRQMLGQPAAAGIASGRARVVQRPEQLFDLQRGEILVCDAIDPGMTFVAPLAAGIVERRGGMLIHGAIIAREYGIPSVTGIADATKRIADGDRVTVDGYLGIVVVDSRAGNGEGGSAAGT